MIFLISSTLSDIAHILSYQIIKPFSCMFCYYSSLDKYKMKLPTKTYHDDKPYYWVNCAKIKQSPNKYMIILICEMPLLCRICDKNFRTSKSTHTITHPIPNAVSETHTGKKPYYHVLCEITMTQTGIKFYLWAIYTTVKHINLICHMTTHTGEKPMKCSHCDNIPLTLYISNPQMPKIMHNKVNIFASTRCIRPNCIIINPGNHMRFLKTEKPYQCSHCDRILFNLTDIQMPSYF